MAALLKYWDKDGNEIGFMAAMKLQAMNPTEFAKFQAAKRGGIPTGGGGTVHGTGGGESFRLNSSVAVKGDTIVHGRDKHSLAGAHATVDTAGEIDKRVTATRLILTGPLAFGLRKKKDTRQLFLLVEGDGFGFTVEVDPNKQKKARDFAVKLNAAARRAGDRTATAAPSPASIPAQIKQLGELRDQGLLTTTEFEAKTTELLDRL